MWSDFVANSPAMWQVYQTAKTYRVRASELLGISDPWTAFCLDNAVSYFGTSLEAELESIEGKTAKEINKQRERTMDKWMGIPQRYKSPGASKHSDVVHDVTVRGEVS